VVCREDNFNLMGITNVIKNTIAVQSML